MQLDLLYSFFYCLHEQTEGVWGYKYTDIGGRGLYSMEIRQSAVTPKNHMAAKGVWETTEQQGGWQFAIFFLAFSFFFFIVISLCLYFFLLLWYQLSTTTFFSFPQVFFFKIKNSNRKKANDTTGSKERVGVSADAAHVQTFVMKWPQEGASPLVTYLAGVVGNDAVTLYSAPYRPPFTGVVADGATTVRLTANGAPCTSARPMVS